jgi:hypothetical protein
MSDDYSFMEGLTQEDTGVLKNIAEMGQRLKELALDAELKEIAAKEAKTAYDQYRTMTLPAAMFSAGVRDVTLNDGSRIVVNTKVYCSPNKNDNDRKIMREWLQAHGGESLLKEQLIVDGQFAERVADIPHAVLTDINTNSLKAWLKDQLGLNNGTPQFNAEDIPPCMHFVQLDEVTIEANG